MTPSDQSGNRGVRGRLNDLLHGREDEAHDARPGPTGAETADPGPAREPGRYGATHPPGPQGEQATQIPGAPGAGAHRLAEPADGGRPDGPFGDRPGPGQPATFGPREGSAPPDPARPGPAGPQPGAVAPAAQQQGQSWSASGGDPRPTHDGPGGLGGGNGGAPGGVAASGRSPVGAPSWGNAPVGPPHPGGAGPGAPGDPAHNRPATGPGDPAHGGPAAPPSAAGPAGPPGAGPESYRDAPAPESRGDERRGPGGDVRGGEAPTRDIRTDEPTGGVPGGAGAAAGSAVAGREQPSAPASARPQHGRDEAAGGPHGSGTPAAPADGPGGARSDRPERLVPAARAQELSTRWDAVKGSFVDEPRDAVRQADTLVGELLDELDRLFREQRRELEHGLDTDDTSTEDLRMALRRYRSFFDRLVDL